MSQSHENPGFHVITSEQPQLIILIGQTEPIHISQANRLRPSALW